MVVIETSIIRNNFTMASLIRQFGAKGDGEEHLNNPCGVLLSSNDSLIVADNVNGRLKVINASTVCLSVILMSPLVLLANLPD